MTGTNIIFILHDFWCIANKFGPIIRDIFQNKRHGRIMQYLLYYVQDAVRREWDSTAAWRSCWSSTRRTASASSVRSAVSCWRTVLTQTRATPPTEPHPTNVCIPFPSTCALANDRLDTFPIFGYGCWFIIWINQLFVSRLEDYIPYVRDRTN